jgi:hypothetical protein
MALAGGASFFIVLSAGLLLLQFSHGWVPTRPAAFGHLRRPLHVSGSSDTTVTTTPTAVDKPDFTYVPAPSDDIRQQLVQPLRHADGEAILNERRAVFVRMRSMSPRRLHVWKVVSKAGEPVNMRALDGLEGSCAGTIEPAGLLHFSTAADTHIFYTADDGDGAPVVGQFRVAAEEQTYVIHDDVMQYRPSAEDTELCDREQRFLTQYRAQRGGENWRHYYGFMGPRGAPKLPSWPANTDARVTSGARYWTGPDSRAPAGEEEVQLRVRSVCGAPRIYVIEDFLSAYEVDAVVASAAPTLTRSLVGTTSDGGSRESHVRTSSNTWLPRNSSQVVATLYERAADVMGIPRSVFLPEANAVEDLQVRPYVNVTRPLSSPYLAPI